MNYHEASSSAGRFFAIAEALCWAVGKAIRPGFISAVLAMVVVRRIHRVRGALLALEARFLAGRVRRRVVRAVVVGSEPAVRVVRRRVSVAERLPRGFACLFPLVPGDAACFAGQLRVVLAEPGMVALLAGCPQAVRVLAPLCRMLGIEREVYVPAGVLAAKAAAVAERRAARVKVPRKARVGFDWAREDAHYAITQVPRKWRLRVR
jgi:hypothetical protein